MLKIDFTSGEKLVFFHGPRDLKKNKTKVDRVGLVNVEGPLGLSLPKCNRNMGRAFMGSGTVQLMAF